jgi:flagellar hook-associated protein 1
MLGLFGTLDLGTRALQTQRVGVEVAGHNIANVNNPAYARQRLDVATSISIQTALGPQGTGVDAVQIRSVRSALLDDQIQVENSVTGYLEAQQSALQFAQSSLGQTIETQTNASGGTGQQGIGDRLNDLFSAFQALSNDPASAASRQSLLMQAADLASRFNTTAQRLQNVHKQLNDSVHADVTEVNSLLTEIVALNRDISRAETSSSGEANDLRDLRQSRIESLSKYASVEVTANADGTLDLSVAGTTLVAGQTLVDSLEAYDTGDGRTLVRAQTSGTALDINNGSIGGAIVVRDGDLKTLRQNLDSLASTLIAEVNAVHQNGYNLTGGTGAAFFSGTGAADIQVNPALLENPALLQASGASGNTGDNQVVLALAQLAQKPLATLNNCTLSDNYAQTVAALGQGLASINTRIEDQQSVQTMLNSQRDSVSGVSLDEELTNIMKFQKAYEASARLVSVVGEMLDTLLQMNR